MAQTQFVKPGLLGRGIRLAMAIALGWFGYSIISASRGFWDGIGPEAQYIPMAAALLLVTSWVVTELTGKKWGQKPTLVLLALCTIAAIIGAFQGDLWGPPLGIVFWAWGVAFTLLLAPAFMLAFLLGTPGCEMRSYAHLWTTLRGGDPAAVACPGWIDRFDGVRLFGK